MILDRHDGETNVITSVLLIPNDRGEEVRECLPYACSWVKREVFLSLFKHFSPGHAPFLQKFFVSLHQLLCLPDLQSKEGSARSSRQALSKKEGSTIPEKLGIFHSRHQLLYMTMAQDCIIPVVEES